jgi:hypothetical protein
VLHSSLQRLPRQGFSFSHPTLSEFYEDGADSYMGEPKRPAVCIEGTMDYPRKQIPQSIM